MTEKEYIALVDSIILEAYREGVSIRHAAYESNLAVMSRLLVYGSIENNRYCLNQLGVEYVLNGCNSGVMQRVARIKRIEELEIKTKGFLAKHQYITFWLSIASILLTIGHILLEYL